MIPTTEEGLLSDMAHMCCSMCIHIHVLLWVHVRVHVHVRERERGGGEIRRNIQCEHKNV